MGNIISDLRQRRKLSKKTLAHDLNVDAGTIDKWENGANIRMENVIASRVFWCIYRRYFRNKIILITNQV